MFAQDYSGERKRAVPAPLRAPWFGVGARTEGADPAQPHTFVGRHQGRLCGGQRVPQRALLTSRSSLQLGASTSPGRARNKEVSFPGLNLPPVHHGARAGVGQRFLPGAAAPFFHLAAVTGAAMESEDGNRDRHCEFLPKLLRKIGQICFPSSSHRMGTSKRASTSWLALPWPNAVQSFGSRGTLGRLLCTKALRSGRRCRVSPSRLPRCQQRRHQVFLYQKPEPSPLPGGMTRQERGEEAWRTRQGGNSLKKK